MTVTLNVGFSGNRHLPAGSGDLIRNALHQVFQLLGQVSDALQTQLLSEPMVPGVDPDTPGLRLLLGVAEGADALAMEAWRKANVGTLHTVVPFLDSAVPTHAADVADGHTALDGKTAETCQPYVNAHLQLARWLTRHAEIMVLVWDHQRKGKPGGTEDGLVLAVRNALPIIWIHPDQPSDIYLITPDRFTESSEAGEIVAALSEAYQSSRLPAFDPETLLHLLRPVILPSWLQGSTGNADKHADQAADHDRLSFLAFVSACHPGQDSAVQRHMDETYKRFTLQLAPDVGARETRPKPPPAHPGESNTALDRLIALHSMADSAADRISARHRSEQIWQLRLAALALFLGVLPALKELPPLAFIPHLKVICVALEGIVLLLMLKLWLQARQSARHRAWSDSRYLAEFLRGAIATWPIGSGTADRPTHASATWCTWLAGYHLRLLGPAGGSLSNAFQLAHAISVGRDLVDTQHTHHRDNAARLGRIHHRLEAREDRLFLLLGFLISVFLLLNLGHYLQPDEVALMLTAPIKYGGSILLFFSAVIPLLGAIIIALDAKLDFSEGQRRSAALAPRFNELAEELEREIGNDAGLRCGRIVQQVADLTMVDVTGWRQDLERRRIVRGP